MRLLQIIWKHAQCTNILQWYYLLPDLVLETKVPDKMENGPNWLRSRHHSNANFSQAWLKFTLFESTSFSFPQQFPSAYTLTYKWIFFLFYSCSFVLYELPGVENLPSNQGLFSWSCQVSNATGRAEYLHKMPVTLGINKQNVRVFQHFEGSS